MKQTLNILKILSDENRLRILFMLKEKKLCVCEMLELLNITGATLSSHLKILNLNKIIESKREGRWIEYCLTDKKTIKLLEYIENNMNNKLTIMNDRKKIKTLNARESICKK
ncbi:MAG: winged helix-turn-helix transcriptional regulator [Spirochaetes bacterium]|nr:winged helix-turn-helix transcriptional regulator [Spirochaetota bacterium]